MALDTTLIAPCGMNCGICLAYLRKERKCPGCLGNNSNKPPTRLNCVIKNGPASVMSAKVIPANDYSNWIKGTGQNTE